MELTLSTRQSVHFLVCVPSQYGGVLVRPQLQIAAFFFSATANSRGCMVVPLCEPSQNPGDFDRPHAAPIISAGLGFLDVGKFLGNDRFAHAPFVTPFAPDANKKFNREIRQTREKKISI